ncbi:MAG: GNAT family N-acetyltransferase [Gammaproteobacteria bacterium]|nr:MAG: GNAT family N-acetyltransferase [Gammaproteobacteria bacterium]
MAAGWHGVTPLQTEIVRTAAEWQALEPAWRRLLADCGSDSPFMTWEWLEPWRAAFAADRPLLVLVVRDGRDVAAILPLVVHAYRRRKLVQRTLRPFGAGLSDRLDLLLHPECPQAATALARALADLRHDWDRVELPDLAADRGLPGRLETALAGAGLIVEREPASRCPCLPLAGDFEHFYRQQVSARTRSKDRAKLRKFNAMPGFQFRSCRDRDDCLAELERIFAMQESSSYHGTPRVRPFDSERAREFFRDATERLSNQGWLLLNLAEAGDELLAYEFGFLYHNRYLDYYGGYSPAHRKLSPGRMVMLNLIERLCAAGVSELDFLRGAEEWKSDWATDCRENESLRIANPGLGSRLRRLLQGS